MGSSGVQVGEVRVYFQSRRAGIEANLAAHVADFIAQTHETLDVAAYDLRHPAVLDALSRLAASGKRVRIAYDSSREHVGGLMGDPKPGGTAEALQTAGLIEHATPIHHGRHLMHDKFLVRDGASVWTGSANFTTGGLELQDNNCLVIPSPQLAQVYTTAFEALLEDDESDRPTAVGPIALPQASVRPYFAPASGERIEDAICALLSTARRVRVLAFLLSDPGILEAILPMGRDHGFDIRGVVDPHGMENALRYTQQAQTHFWFMHDPRFVAAPTHAFNPHTEQDFMHNKVLIIDDRYVVTGSYNFSENAETNDENILIFDSPTLAADYTSYFDRLATTYASHASSAHAPVHAPAHASTLTATEERATPPAWSGPQRASVAVVQEETPMYSEPHASSPRPHVFRRRKAISGLTLANSRQQLANEQVAGSTPHVIVYTDGTANGNASAQAVLKSFEADFAQITQWFGGVQLPPGQDGNDQNTVRTATPIQVAMDPNAGGAYHYGCNATDVYIEPDPAQASGLVVAEVVEIFEAAINNGWSCGQTNGEALSRVLAVARNSALASLIAETGQLWWSDGHQDYVTNNNATDQDQDSNGCGPLFLYYLHDQLNFSWTQITTTGGATLGDTYQRLTGKSPSEGFNDFIARLSTLASGGQLQLPANGNPFPIQAQGQPGSTGNGGSGSAGDPGTPNIPVVAGKGGLGAGITTLIILIVLVLIALGISLAVAIH